MSHNYLSCEDHKKQKHFVTSFVKIGPVVPDLWLFEGSDNTPFEHNYQQKL